MRLELAVDNLRDVLVRAGDQVVARHVRINSLEVTSEGAQQLTLAGTIGNYGSDYLGRSLVNLAGIWANNNNEAVYFKSNTDGEGQPLDGSTVYTMTFPKDELPQHLVRYFWSVIAVDTANYRVIPNPLNRYLLNKQSGVQPNADGSLTLALANQPPPGAVQQNWLPTPAGQNYHLTFRLYGPAEEVKDGAYFPPPLVKAAATVGTGAR